MTLMNLYSRLAFLWLILTFTHTASGQVPSFLQNEPDLTDIKPYDVIIWQPLDATLYADNHLVVNLRLTTKLNFTLYTDKVSFQGSKGFILADMKAPDPKVLMDPISQKEVPVYEAGDFSLVFKGASPLAEDAYRMSVNFLGCTTRICLFPYTQDLAIPVYRSSESYFAKNTEPAPNVIESSQPKIEAGEKDLESTLKDRLTENTSIWIILAIAFVGGFLTNLTPCVYPMIPITIRVLGNQTKTPVLSASMYAIGIIVTYTALGLFAALSGSLFGGFLSSDWFNVAFAIIMMIFGVTMLGYGNLAFLQNLGTKIGGNTSGLKNSFLMGTGAGLVAAPCTGPILATLLTLVAKDSNLFKSGIMLFTYSVGFALPYVLLGSTAAKASNIKVSPKIQTGLKVFFSSAMFALGFYYLRIPFYSLFKQLSDSWDVIMSMGLSLGGMAFVLMMISSRILNKKVFHILPAVGLGLGLFAMTQYLSTPESKELTWIYSEPEALEIAAQENRPIFIDFWAEWCEACKKFENSTLKEERVIKKLLDENWILLKLDVTENNEADEKLLAKYNIQSLPTFIILRPGKPLKDMEEILGYVNASTFIERLDGKEVP